MSADGPERPAHPPAARGPAIYASAWRAFRIIDRVSRGGEGLEVKALAKSLGVSTSTCYQLLRILVDEGYLRKLSDGGYRLGPTISLLYRRSRRRSVESVVEPILHDLARRAGLPACFGVLTENDDVVVALVETPPGSPPAGIPRGLRGPSHALAVGKIQIAAGGVRAIDRYLESHTLAAVTRRTITDPVVLEAHLKEAHARGYATEREEFAKSVYSIAVPVRTEGGGVDGAIGLVALGEDPGAGLLQLVELACRAVTQATTSLRDDPHERRSRRVST